MTKLHTLAESGQAIWFDYIRRSLITSGEMQNLIHQGVRGVTSNPTIFEKAIAGSSDYDEDIKALVKKGTSIEDIYENLALWDIAHTADLFRPLYEQTGALDGYVSIEVSPTLAHDAQKTIHEARRLFSILDRPNIMIKVPATPAGVTATEILISEGINVNVTLLFCVKRYEETALAYLSGLEKLMASGKDISKIASVASFFVSRVDTALDPEFERLGLNSLTGKIAIANAKIAYGIFKNIFSGERWQKLERKGARPQRLLWASTGTKNPNYPDTLYIDELIGPHTVNTVPPATLQAFMDHGRIGDTIELGIDEAKAQIQHISQAGIDLDATTDKLQKDGIESFAGSFRSLMDSIKAKRRELIAGRHLIETHLCTLDKAVEFRIGKMVEDRIISRIWDQDYTVWKNNPKEISNRLGWLEIADLMIDHADEIEQFARQICSLGYTHAYLLGMGGSSLAPEVMREVFGTRSGYLRLTIVDTTDPAALADISQGLKPAESLFIVSTKSGTTVETLSGFHYFYTIVESALGRTNAGEHFIAITDPGSTLVETAAQLHFRRVFLNDPHLGGRYSALSHFGLIPAALMGIDIKTLLDRALVMTENCSAGNCPAKGNNHGGKLGAILGEAALAGKDKVTFVISRSFTAFGDWVEQLIAESTGKEGKGIVPVVREHLGFPGQYRDNRIFVHLRMENDETYDDKINDLRKSGHLVIRVSLQDIYDLGGQFFLWEMSTAVAGYVLGINPFDQPDVETAKIRAREAVEAFKKTGSLPETAPALSYKNISVFGDLTAGDIDEALKQFLGSIDSGSYVAIQAYLPPTVPTDKALDELRMKIRDRYRIATMAGYGPRYLHSTGQLHKGDDGKGLFIQITCADLKEVPIPDEAGSNNSSMSFGTLKTAQALGDWTALKDKGRKVVRFHICSSDIPSAMRDIAEALP